ncbi:MAG: hypothetical protein UX19_C0005G0016 [Candidatus Woesebacteria bacterium GW2011_GWA1_45_8]|uniref:DUF4134 domain-containing protein n=1 Tax=Candidatus Woesebacteria bacterium GW2011_GWA1_45_8 TaxID=1618559 RepID=A0A0G1MVC1_9BACT|nr:MAG: hypothetical protein UX19_C0005G0016 [Candidatus Woesebacteria bacterium GW2011_GWA1_45_8]
MRLAQTWSNQANSSAATLQDLEVVFANIVSAILGFAGIVLFVLLIMGGFKYITAGGDPKAVDGAKKTLTYAIVGFVLVASAFLILRFIEVFTGINVTVFRVFQP